MYHENQSVCPVCNTSLALWRKANARYCSGRCKQKAYRARKKRAMALTRFIQNAADRLPNRR